MFFGQIDEYSQNRRPDGGRALVQQIQQQKHAFSLQKPHLDHVDPDHATPNGVEERQQQSMLSQTGRQVRCWVDGGGSQVRRQHVDSATRAEYRFSVSINEKING